MTAITIYSDFGAQEDKVCHYFHVSPSFLAIYEVDIGKQVLQRHGKELVANWRSTVALGVNVKPPQVFLSQT